MVRQLIPPDLAEMAPGPELSALLAGIDIHALIGADVVEVLRARVRQLSYEQARVLATMVEVGLCDPDARGDEVARLVESPPYAADEIRAALAWTRRAADRELDFAEALVLRMPAVFTALEAGRIDRSKAWVFTDLCADLTPEQAEVVCTRLLPHAERLTTGELAARIKRLAIALDPEWAARRYATAVRERNVIGYLDLDGSATVTGTGLPVEQAASACAHVEELARAAKRAGHPGRIGPLRADIYLGLLDGRWQHHTREEIITDLLTNAIHDTSDAESGPDLDHPTESGPATSPSTGGQNPARDARGSAPADTVPAGNVPADPVPAGPVPAHPVPAHPVPAHPVPAHPVPAGHSSGPAARDVARVSGPVPLARRVGVEIRVGLATLLGRDRHCGEVAGWGPVPAEVARAMVIAQRTAQWRFALTDPAGQLLLAGITRRRLQPAASEQTPSTAPPCRGGIVELQLPVNLLTELAADPGACGDWAGIVTDLAAQYTQHIHGGVWGPGTQDPTARFAGAALRRHVQIRDRYCVYPGCRAAASSSDLDHTVDHTYGGPTDDANSGPQCRHDHQLKTAGRWRLHQPLPGHFTWISPLGRSYHTQPPPIILDLPDPRPRPREPDYPPVVAPDDDTPILERPPPQPDPPPPLPPPDPDEPPPF